MWIDGFCQTSLVVGHLQGNCIDHFWPAVEVMTYSCNSCNILRPFQIPARTTTPFCMPFCDSSGKAPHRPAEGMVAFWMKKQGHCVFDPIVYNHTNSTKKDQPVTYFLCSQLLPELLQAIPLFYTRLTILKCRSEKMQYLHKSIDCGREQLLSVRTWKPLSSASFPDPCPLHAPLLTVNPSFHSDHLEELLLILRWY